MKLLPNLLSQRREWKMMLFGFQVEPLELVGVYGQPGLSVEVSPCASKWQIYIFFSCCFPHQNLPIANRWEGGGGEPSGRPQGPQVRQHTRLVFVLDAHLTAAAFAPSPLVPGCKGFLRPQNPVSCTADRLCFSGPAPFETQQTAVALHSREARVHRLVYTPSGGWWIP